jgi:hypothetical protein
MALDFDVDLNVSLETVTKYENLYNWCLKESKENGDQIGRDLIPFRWSTAFHSTSFGVQRSISSERSFRFDEEQELESLKFSKEDVIFAKLEYGYYEDDGWRTPSIAMVGSTREILDISLRIQCIDDVQRETCRVWGSLAFESDTDFRSERIEDSLQITYYLEHKKFNSLFELISNNQVDRLTIRLSDVEGFYSDWSPSIFPDFIKVLARVEDHGLQVDEEWKKRIPMLGKVGEASLTVNRTLEAKMPKCADESTNDLLDDAYDNGKTVSPEKIGTVVSKGDLQNKFYERALSRISKLLGILIAIEIVRIFAS